MKILASTNLQHGENHMVGLSHPIFIEIKIIWDSSKKKTEKEKKAVSCVGISSPYSCVASVANKKDLEVI